MRERPDHTGKRFGLWTVVERTEDRRSGPYWLLRCDCGNEREVSQHSFVSGQSKNCGCVRNKALAARNTKHGHRDHRLYSIWRGMLGRCYLPRHKWYKNYGGRSKDRGGPVTVCDEWRASFAAFFEWAMANGYKDELTFDRVKSELTYEPGNCRWATYAEQNRNRRLRPRATKRDCVVA